MAKATRDSMLRRGRKYLIERSPEGTFLRFVPQTKTAVKKASAKRTSSKISTKPSLKSHKPKSSSKRARV
jgi:hypothetical protein